MFLYYGLRFSLSGLYQCTHIPSTVTMWKKKVTVFSFVIFDVGFEVADL